MDNLDFITPAEAREMLRISKSAFYKMLQGGELPAFKIGKQWRFRRSTLSQWVAEREQHSVATPESINA